MQKNLNNIYISLTTIKDRIENLPKVLNSLINQTVKPNKIYLFLSKQPYLLDEGFLNTEIPKEIIDLQKSGILEIRYTKNIGPYRKLLPLLKEKFQEECSIITADDDVIYPPEWLEQILKESDNYPDKIISFRNRYIQFNALELEPYNAWPLVNSNFIFRKNYQINDQLIFPTGIGGVLYKPHFFDDRVFNEIFLQICPFGDDIWFKFMAMLNGTTNHYVVSKYMDSTFKSVSNFGSKTLNFVNLQNTPTINNINNDIQIKNIINFMMSEYGFDILEKIFDSSIKTTPVYNKKLEGSIWGITTLFNPAGYKTKKENFLKFRESSQKQKLKLCVVELAFDDNPFILSEKDADILVQIRGSSSNILWQKEALLNIALKKIPNDCDKIIWVDCDLVFEDDDWVNKTARLLEKYVIVQPFKTAIILPKNKKIEDINVDKMKFGKLDGQKRDSIAYTRSKYFNRGGHPGYVWAARREVFEELHFYDRLIVGSADVLLSDSFYSPVLSIKKDQLSEHMIKDMSEYSEKLFSKAKGSVGFLNGNIFHLWHGNLKKRRYLERMFFLKRYFFNPQKDVYLNKDGILEWTNTLNPIRTFVHRYFRVRNEDKKIFFDLKSFFIFDFFYWFNVDGVKNVLMIKKDYLLGRLGLIIKNISPKIYEKLVKSKPNWAKSVFEN